MGMYDELTCKYPLPEEYADMQDREFQTKSLESLLDHYTITEDGELWIRQAEREWVTDPKSVLGGYAKAIREWDERVEDFQGDILENIIVVPERDAIPLSRSVR